MRVTLIRWGKRVVGVACRDRSVTASFGDGTQADGDVLIGADGLNSTIRELIDPTAPAPRYVGQRIFYGSSTNPGLHSHPDYFQVVRGVAAFGYIVTARDDVWWFARIVDDELDRRDLTPDATPRWRAELAALMRHKEAATPAIVQAARRILVTNAYDLPDVSRWHRTGMLIIGDAAHAASRHRPGRLDGPGGRGDPGQGPTRSARPRPRVRHLRAPSTGTCASEHRRQRCHERTARGEPAVAEVLAVASSPG